MKSVKKELKKMTNKVKISKEGAEFLENLRVYLFSNGKKWDEIEAIVDELETHLIEAEEKGKPIEKYLESHQRNI